MSLMTDQQWQSVKKTLKARGENKNHLVFPLQISAYLQYMPTCRNDFICAAHVARVYPVNYIIICTVEREQYVVLKR